MTSTGALRPSRKPLPNVGTQLVEASRALFKVAIEYHDSNACRFDHNQFCQEHASPHPCRNALLRLAMARFPAEWFALEDLDEQAVLGTPAPAEAASDRLGLLGESLLAEIRRLNARLDVLGQPENTSSFEIDSNGSAGKVKVKAKQYAATVEEARAAAEVEFVRGMANLETFQERGWRETLALFEDPPATPAIDIIRDAWSRARLGSPEACTELDALLGVPS